MCHSLTQLSCLLVGIVEKVGIAGAHLLTFPIGIDKVIVGFMCQFGSGLTTIFTDIENATLISSPREIIEEFARQKRLSSRGQAHEHNEKSFRGGCQVAAFCKTLSHDGCFHGKLDISLFIICRGCRHGGHDCVEELRFVLDLSCISSSSGKKVKRDVFVHFLPFYTSAVYGVYNVFCCDCCDDDINTLVYLVAHLNDRCHVGCAIIASL